MQKPSIRTIKQRTKDTAPHFFDEDTLRFFGQDLSDFSVHEQPDGRYLISAPRWFDGKRNGYTQRFYNPITHELTME